MTHTPTLQSCPNPWCEAQERDGDFSPYVFRTNYGNWRVSCTSCTQEGPTAPTEAGAITAWNTRTEAIEAGAVQGLVDAAEKLSNAERGYRLCHDVKGDGHIETGRAWDHMRKCGDELRNALSRLAETSNEVA